MIKYTLAVDGMMCGMCEAHVNGAVRRAFAVKKVSSSRAKRQTVVLAEAPLDEAALKQAIAAAGYTVLAVTSEPYQKRACLAEAGPRGKAGQNFYCRQRRKKPGGR